MTATPEAIGQPTMQPGELEQWLREMRGEDCCARNKPLPLKVGKFYACPECHKTWICTTDPAGALGFEEV